MWWCEVRIGGYLKQDQRPLAYSVKEIGLHPTPVHAGNRISLY